MTSSDPGPAGSRFRPDVEGLRALAVTSVLLHHAGLAVPSGGFAGVDVFFVVSGFVITTQLLRELDQTGRIRLGLFYARRAKRLLPAASLVLVVTTLAAWVGVSRVQWRTIATDVIGAATYVVNWVFADRAVDYMAEDVPPSPLLHFWSLAVEEQFYLVWPLVIIALVWVSTRRRGRPHRGALAAGLLLVIVLPSLAWAMVMTAEQPLQAFFVTTTRLWELGIGALVALGAGLWTRVPVRVAAVVGWLGLATIVAGMVWQDTSTPWPGPGALVPTLGTAAVVVAGFAAAERGPGRVLGLRPLVWLGGLSYSLYLWHWPVLRMAHWQWGEPSAATGLLLVVLAVVPAWLSYRFLEAPVRHSRRLSASPGLALSLGLNCTLVAVVAGLLLQHAVTASRPAGPVGAGRGIELTPEDLRGEGPSSRAGTTPLFAVVTPDPVDAVRDAPALYAKGCAVDVYDTDVRSCDSGDPAGDVLVAVVGDSKIAQWMPAIDPIARENGWRVRLYTKGGCTFTDTMTLVEGDPFEECRSWGQEVFRRITAPGARPDVLITSGLRKGAVDGTGEETAEGLVAGYVGYWRVLEAQGTEVVAVSDTPSPAPEIGANAYECVAEHDAADVDEACSWPFVEMSSNLAMRAAAEQVDGSFLDLNPHVCPEGTCRAVLRNVLTYRQGSHLTATYVRYLAPRLAAELVPAVRRHLRTG